MLCFLKQNNRDQFAFSIFLTFFVCFLFAEPSVFLLYCFVGKYIECLFGGQSLSLAIQTPLTDENKEIFQVLSFICLLVD